MKKHGKILAIAAAVVMCLTMALGLVACGESQATVTDVYSTEGRYWTTDGVPPLVYTASINVSVYSDNTYMLVEEEGGYMAVYGGTNVGHFTTVMYGTFTQEAGTDEGTVTLKLSKPTRITYRAYVMSGGTAYYDTDNAATFETDEDVEDPVTAASLLEKGKELTITVDTAKSKITAGVEAGEMSALLQA